MSSAVAAIVSPELTAADIRKPDWDSSLLEAAEASLRTAPIALTGHVYGGLHSCPYRKLCPAVLMVQATEDGCRSDSRGARDRARRATPA